MTDEMTTPVAEAPAPAVGPTGMPAASNAALAPVVAEVKELAEAVDKLGKRVRTLLISVVVLAVVAVALAASVLVPRFLGGGLPGGPGGRGFRPPGATQQQGTQGGSGQPGQQQMNP